MSIFIIASIGRSIFAGDEELVPLFSKELGFWMKRVPEFQLFGTSEDMKKFLNLLESLKICYAGCKVRCYD